MDPKCEISFGFYQTNAAAGYILAQEYFLESTQIAYPVLRETVFYSALLYNTSFLPGIWQAFPSFAFTLLHFLNAEAAKTHPAAS